MGGIVAQHQLFDDMADRDAHLRCEFDKRRGSVLGLDWSIAPPANASRAEKKLAAWVEEILRDVVDDLELDTARRSLRLDDGSSDGAAPIPMGWIMHQHLKAKTGYLGRMGLSRVLVWPFLCKRTVSTTSPSSWKPMACRSSSASIRSLRRPRKSRA